MHHRCKKVRIIPDQSSSVIDQRDISGGSTLWGGGGRPVISNYLINLVKRITPHGHIIEGVTVYKKPKPVTNRIEIKIKKRLRELQTSPKGFSPQEINKNMAHRFTGEATHPTFLMICHTLFLKLVATSRKSWYRFDRVKLSVYFYILT